MNKNGQARNNKIRNHQIPVDGIRVRSDTLVIDHKFICIIYLIIVFRVMKLILNNEQNK